MNDIIAAIAITLANFLASIIIIKKTIKPENENGFKVYLFLTSIKFFTLLMIALMLPKLIYLNLNEFKFGAYLLFFYFVFMFVEIFYLNKLKK